MTDLSLRALQTASLFRLSKHVEAGLLLANYFDELVDLKNVDSSDLGNVIACIVSCQEHKDWLGLADYLEFELVHIIGEAA